MPTIHITSFAAAPAEIVYDLSRNASLQKISLDKEGKQPVAGITSGLLNSDDFITWKGKHLFKTRIFSSKITEMKEPGHFINKMTKGDFLSFEHHHFFKEAVNGTIIIDIIYYEMPFGIIGRLVDRFYMYKHLEKLIHLHNNTIREYAESDKWRALLSNR